MTSTPRICATHAAPRRLLASTLGSLFISASAAAVAEANNVPDLPDASKERELDSVKVDGYVVSEPTSAKFTAPLLDTPRSVSVLPGELTWDVGARSGGCAAVIRGITFGGR